MKSQLSDEYEIPVFQNSLKPLGFYKDSNVKAGSTFLISAGAAGDLGFCNVDFWAADDCFVFETSADIHNKYLFYILQTHQKSIYAKVRRASVPRLSRTSIEKIKIPVPPLSEQQRIVDILDKFDALVNDISSGIPAEIAARRKQYEHYRSRLLSFRKLETA